MANVKKLIAKIDSVSTKVSKYVSNGDITIEEVEELHDVTDFLLTYLKCIQQRLGATNTTDLAKKSKEVVSIFNDDDTEEFKEIIADIVDKTNDSVTKEDIDRVRKSLKIAQPLISMLRHLQGPQ